MEIKKLIEEYNSINIKNMNESVSTIEDLCWKYGFLTKRKAMFDSNNDKLTKDGDKAYGKLIDFLNDLGNLTGGNINDLVEKLDNIVDEPSY